MSVSTMVCALSAIAQGCDKALGARVGEAALHRVAEQAGVIRFRRATETPAFMVPRHVPELRSRENDAATMVPRGRCVCAEPGEVHLDGLSGRTTTVKMTAVTYETRLSRP